MMLFGWRFTYAPELETSWDAISAVAAWVGVIASFIAIWFAIQIPKKIADRQDKIALFEKRYDCFLFFERCHRLYIIIEEKECSLEELRRAVLYLFEEYAWVDLTKETLICKIERYRSMLHQMTFLFPAIGLGETSELYMSLQAFITSVYEDKNISMNKEKYVRTMGSFSQNHSTYIFELLTI